MATTKHTTAPNRFVTFATFVLVIAVLRFTEDVMIPIALALLLSFLLTPLVLRLTRWKLPRTMAILLTASLAFAVMGVVGWQITKQAVSLLGELPGYESNLQKKIHSLKKPEATGTLSRAVSTVEKMWADLQAADAPPPTMLAEGAPKPMPVEVKTSNRTALELARDLASHLFKPLGTAGIVIVFVIAILFQRDDLRNRFIRVISGGKLNAATEAVDDAAKRVSRYLIAQLMVNTCFGITIGAGLFAIGIPHAGLWGLLATILRFIPFLGPLIAASFPLLLSVAVDPGWSMFLWTGLLFLTAELVTNNVVEVLVYGTSTGISTLALLIAAVFWSWLWGLAGLFLSTPLTVCLLVIGQYVPGLKFLSVLLGSEPPLSPSAQFYQTMLTMNQEELFDMAVEHVEKHSLASFYDDVFVPALLMSEVDRHSGVLAEVRQKFIFESGRELIEELSTRSSDRLSPQTDGKEEFSAEKIVGIPARDEADELVALMLAHLLREQGLSADVLSVTAQTKDFSAAVKQENVTVYISALPPSTLSAAVRTCRRVKLESPSCRTVVGVWSSEANLESLQRRLDPAGADEIATRLSEAVVQIRNRTPTPAPNSGQPEVPTEAKRKARKPEEATDWATRELARVFDVPLSLVSLIETDRDFWQPTRGTTESPHPPNETSFYDGVLVSEDLLVVEDVARDERFGSNPLLVKRGVKAFASMPLRRKNGHLVGNLCLLDTKPRQFSEEDRQRLESIAAELMTSVEPSEPTPVLTASTE